MFTVKGIKWPLEFYAGRVSASDGEDHIRESVRQIIAIGKGEYLLKPEFGCELSRRVFDPINVSALVDGDIREALQLHEPRVTINGTGTDFSRAAEGVIGIKVDFTITGIGHTDSADLALRR